MKIYPAPHQVRAAQIIRFDDIPVAHIEKEYHPQSIDVQVNPDFSKNTIQYLAPYQKFVTDNFLAFDTNNKKVDPDLRYQNYRYVYYPEIKKEFEPETFSYSAVVKKHDTFTYMKNYDIKTGILQQNSADKLSKSLISIFGDSAYRGLSPVNVSINGRDKQPSNLIKKSPDGLDFLFIQTDDGTSTKDGVALDYNTLLSYNCNLWVTLSSTGTIFKTLDEKSDGYDFNHITIARNDRIIYSDNEKTHFGKEYGYLARTEVRLSSLSGEGFHYLIPNSVKTPILIIRKDYGGYIVFSHENIFEHLETYLSFIYNIMLQIYMNSYIRTDSEELWITDYPVDYYGSLDIPLHKNHPDINIKDKIAEISNTTYYTIVANGISKNDIKLKQQDSKGNLYFEKIAKTDPEKEVDDVSIFTTQRTIAYCGQQKYRLVESAIVYHTEITDDEKCYITIEPFVSSKYRIISSSSKRFQIENPEDTYTVYALPINKDNESEFFIIDDKDNNFNTKSAIELCTIRVIYAGEPASYDVRLLGGGIPETKYNYEMLDIGNLKGRPYRIGTGAVIKLPEVFKKYDERILSLVEKYKVAADKFYTVYEK